MKLVIHPSVDDARVERITLAAPALSIVNAADSAHALREIADADGFFGKLTPELLGAAKRLRWVQSPTASLEHYMFPALVDHPCLLSNMRGIFSDVIADHVMGMVLCFARNLHIYLRQRTWAPVGDPAMAVDFVSAPGRVSAVDASHQHLADLSLGVIGAGAIGAETLRRAAAFGLMLRAVDPVVRRVEGFLDEVWTMDRLDELLEKSDYVVIAAPHTPQTYKLFRRPLIQRMKRSAYLINIGRGAIVDLADLTAALQAGEIAGAGLDVSEFEPLPDEHPLWGMRNVIITPHVGAASPRIAERHLETLLENVRRFEQGEQSLNLVDKHNWF